MHVPCPICLTTNSRRLAFSPIQALIKFEFSRGKGGEEEAPLCTKFSAAPSLLTDCPADCYVAEIFARDLCKGLQGPDKHAAWPATGSRLMTE